MSVLMMVITVLAISLVPSDLLQVSVGNHLGISKTKPFIQSIGVNFSHSIVQAKEYFA